MTFGVLARAAIACIALGFALRAQAQAQTTRDLETLNERVEKHLQNNRFKEGLPLAQQAVAMAEKLHGKDGKGVSHPLDVLGLFLLHTGRFAEAEPVFKRILAFTEAEFGKTHSVVANTLNRLVWIYTELRRFDDVDAIRRHQIAIYEANPNLNIELALALGEYAEFLQSQGRLAESEASFERALSIFEKKPGTLSSIADGLRNDLKAVRKQMGK